MYKKYYLMCKEYFFACSDAVWLCFNLKARIEDRLCYTVYRTHEKEEKEYGNLMLKFNLL